MNKEAGVKDAPITNQQDKISIYLAAPFFSPQEIEKVKQVEDMLDSLENVQTFSPFRDGIVCKSNSPIETQKKAFSWNIDSIKQCDVMVAIIDKRKIQLERDLVKNNGMDYQALLEKYELGGNGKVDNFVNELLTYATKDDAGTSFEMGMAYALGIPLVTILIDENDSVNLMLSHSMAVLSEGGTDKAKEFVKLFADTTVALRNDLSEINVRKMSLKEKNQSLMKQNAELAQEAQKIDEDHREKVESYNDSYTKLNDFKNETIYKGAIE